MASKFVSNGKHCLTVIKKGCDTMADDLEYPSFFNLSLISLLCLSVCLPVSLSLSLSIFQSLSLSINMYISLCIYVYDIYISLFLSISLSLSIYQSLSSPLSCLHFTNYICSIAFHSYTFNFFIIIIICSILYLLNC